MTVFALTPHRAVILGPDSRIPGRRDHRVKPGDDAKKAAIEEDQSHG